jgi:hypothetical protein
MHGEKLISRPHNQSVGELDERRDGQLWSDTAGLQWGGGSNKRDKNHRKEFVAALSDAVGV